MQILIRELSGPDRASLEAHFLALGGEDRRLRFNISLNDGALRAYVGRIDFGYDAIFGVHDDALRVIGAAHVARSAKHAELGISVLPGHRGRGVGGALLARAHLRARNWGLRSLFMHCLIENRAMMYLARKQAMQIAIESGAADAWLRLPPADACSHFGEVFAERVALFDYALKRGRAWLGPER
jgi:GNAT superfamily N-acetyltransferase